MQYENQGTFTCCNTYSYHHLLQWLIPGLYRKKEFFQMIYFRWMLPQWRIQLKQLMLENSPGSWIYRNQTGNRKQRCETTMESCPSNDRLLSSNWYTTYFFIPEDHGHLLICVIHEAGKCHSRQVSIHSFIMYSSKSFSLCSQNNPHYTDIQYKLHTCGSVCFGSLV